MQAIRELQQVKKRLEDQVSALQSELDTVDKAIKILEREIPGSTPQMNLPGSYAKGTVISKVPVDVDVAVGLTDVCRSMAEDWVAPTEVRNRLLSVGYRISDKSKLLSSVYATLKRLTESGKMESRKVTGRTEFRNTREAQAA